MKLRLKNGLTVALIRMIKNARERGGVPDFVTVTTSEARTLLDEINVCKDRYVITISATSIELDVLCLSTDKAKEEFIDKWKNNEYIIEFKDEERIIIEINDETF